MFKPGDRVLYKGKEKGVVKVVKIDEEGKEKVWVVYKCGEDWDNYMNYTGALTPIELLVSGWMCDPIKRLRIEVHDNGEFPFYETYEDEDGDYIHYLDVKILVDAVRNFIEVSKATGAWPLVCDEEIELDAIIQKFINF